MGLRRAFAGAALGGFIGALTGIPGLPQVGAAAGMASGPHQGQRFVDNHPQWADNHPRAASILERSGPFGSFAGQQFVNNHPVWADRHPYAAGRMDLGGPSFSRSLSPGMGIAATGGFALGGLFNSFAQGLTSAVSPSQPAPMPQDSFVSRNSTLTTAGPGFGFNNV